MLTVAVPGPVDLRRGGEQTQPPAGRTPLLGRPALAGLLLPADTLWQQDEAATLVSDALPRMAVAVQN